MARKSGRNFGSACATRRAGIGRQRCRWHPLACIAVPPRGPDLGRLLAALNEQRAALGQPPWTGLATERALGAASLAAVTDALAGGCAAAAGCAAGGRPVQPWPARAAGTGPDGGGAGPAVRGDPVRAGPAAHPRHAAERRRDRPADVAGSRRRAGWTGRQRGRGRPGAGQRPAGGPICLPSAHVQRPWQAGKSLELTSD